MIDRIRDMGEGMGPQVEQVREQALDMMATAREQWARGNEAVRHFTIEQPAKALGIALGMGVFLGWLIKRR